MSSLEHSLVLTTFLVRFPIKAISIASIILLLIGIYGYISNIEWLKIVITIIGIAASIIGLLITLKQIQDVKEITSDTQKIVEQNNKTISKIWSIKDLSEIIKDIELIDHYLLENEFHFAMIRIQDIRTKLIDMVNNERLGKIYNMDETKSIISLLSNDYANIKKQIENIKPIKKDIISNNLLNLKDILITIKAKLTQI